jgi:hypothetical protein
MNATQPSDRRGRVQDRFDARSLGDVGDWLASKRAEGLSWATISMDLRDLVGLTVSYETLRRWGQDDEDGETS